MILSLRYIVKCIFYCFLQRSGRNTPDVIYFIKGAFPSARSNTINKARNIFRKKGITQEGVIFSFSNKNESYGNYFISSFNASRKAVIISSLNVLRYALSDLKLYFHFQLPGRFIYTYLLHSFKSMSLISLNSKVIFGVLEKNYSILIDRYKKNDQKTCTFSDGLLFYPNISIKYVHADNYYSTNTISTLAVESDNWSIQHVKEVGFIGIDMKAKSEGVSDDLKQNLSKYSFTVLVALSQVSSNEYYTIDVKYFEHFFDKIIKIAYNNQDCLFIIKEKKGELDEISSQFSQKLSKCSNIFLVTIDRPHGIEKLTPYSSRYNHFEDLLQEVNLLISLAWESTVIWQALRIKIPAIAYNDSFDYSFLNQFNYLEVRNKDLEDAFNYWKNIERADFNKFLNDLDSKTNILQTDGMKKMLENICTLVT